MKKIVLIIAGCALLIFSSCKKESNEIEAKKSESVELLNGLKMPVQVYNQFRYGNLIKTNQEAEKIHKDIFNKTIAGRDASSLARGTRCYDLLSSSSVITSIVDQGCGNSGSVLVTIRTQTIEEFNCNLREMTFNSSFGVTPSSITQISYGWTDGGYPAGVQVFDLVFNIPSEWWNCNDFVLITTGTCRFGVDVQTVTETVSSSQSGGYANTFSYVAGSNIFVGSGCSVLCYPPCLICPTSISFNYQNIIPGSPLNSVIVPSVGQIIPVAPGTYNFSRTATYPGGIVGVTVTGTLVVN
jgi:hypothetical protein